MLQASYQDIIIGIQCKAVDNETMHQLFKCLKGTCQKLGIQLRHNLRMGKAVD